MRQTLQDLDPLWDELFPAEQARIVQLLVERIDVGTQGFDLRLRVDGLAHLVRDLSSGGGANLQQAAGPRRRRPSPCGCPSSSASVAAASSPYQQTASTLAPPRSRIDNTLVKALARAHRWNRLLETGRYSSAAELAAAEKINPSYVTRVC